MTIDDIAELKNIIVIICNAIYNNNDDMCDECYEDIFDQVLMDELSYLEIENYIEILKNIFSNIDITDEKNRAFVFNIFTGLMILSKMDVSSIFNRYKKQLSRLDLTREEELQFVCIEVLYCFIQLKVSSINIFNKDYEKIREANWDFERSISKFLEVFETMTLEEKEKNYMYLMSRLIYCFESNGYLYATKNVREQFDKLCNIYFELQKEFDENDYDCDFFYDDEDIEEPLVEKKNFFNMEYDENEDHKKETKEKTDENEEKEESWFAKLYDDFDQLIEPKIEERLATISGAFQDDAGIFFELVSKKEDEKTVINKVKECSGFIAERCFYRYVGLGSDYYGSSYNIYEADIYEYFARKNSYMLLYTQTLLLNRSRKEQIWDIASIKYMSGFKSLNLGMYAMAIGWNPIFELEYLKTIWQSSFTPEKIKEEKEREKNYIYDLCSLDFALGDFINTSKYFAKRFNEKSLYELIETGETNLLNYKLIIEEDDIETGESIDATKIWDEIERLFEKVCEYDDDQLTDLRNEIMKNSVIPEEYRELLLDATAPKISFFDAAMLDEKVNISKHVTCDIEKLEKLVEKQNIGDFKGLEEANNLLEIYFQYKLLKNHEKEAEYLSLIYKYIEENKEYHGKLNYILYNFVQMFLKGCLNIGIFDDECFDLAAYLVDDWAREYMDQMDYTTMEMIRMLTLLNAGEIYKLIPGEREVNLDGPGGKRFMKFVNGTVEFDEKCDDIDASFIGIEHMRECSDRLYGVYTDERRDEYARRANELKEKWHGEKHTKEEYQEKYREIFDDVFPMPDEEI